MTKKVPVKFPIELLIVPGDSVLQNGYKIKFRSVNNTQLVLFKLENKIPVLSILKSRSGAGKSTFLRSLFDYTNCIRDRSENDLSFRVLSDSLTKIDIDSGYVPQSPLIINHWKIKSIMSNDNPFFPLFFPDTERSSFLNKYLGEFSGGQQKRLYTASVLQNLTNLKGHIKLLLLDETFDGIGAEDTKNCLERLMTAWNSISDSVLCILIVTHLGQHIAPPNYTITNLDMTVKSESTESLFVELNQT